MLQKKFFFGVFALAALTLVLLASEANSLDISEHVFLKGSRSALHKRDFQDDPHAVMIKKVFHFDHDNDRLAVTILKVCLFETDGKVGLNH